MIGVVTAGAAGLVALGLVRPVATDAPALRATAESLITVLAGLGALLLGAQVGHTRRLRDLIMFGALVLFTLVELAGAALPAALQLRSGGEPGAALQFGQLFVAAAIVAAAFTSPNKLVAGYRRPLALVVALGVVAFAVAELGGLFAHHEFVVSATHPRFGIGPALDRPLAFATALITTALFACGAAQLARRGQLERDDALDLMSAAVVLLTATRLYFVAVPWLSHAWISPGEGLCLLAVALIVAAGVRRQHAIRAEMVRASAIAERRKVARDLHDGLAQDLAFIAAHGVLMTQELGDGHPLMVAARRALALSRDTISELSDLRGMPLRDGLEATAHELRDRFQMAIVIDADVRADVSSDLRENVLRIAREAIANAGRHGHAKNVLVSLSHTSDGLALRVRDDGSGIRCDAVAPEGFGLSSMRERAAGLGGRLTVHERRGGGTELEVVLP